MGKASSNKKVARAAGISGGRNHRRNTPWGYFGIIALILVLGIAGTIQSRDRRNSQISAAGTVAPTVGTTWNEGYAVYACGKFLPAISIKSKDPHGITTRKPGIILIHPTSKSVAGKNATLGKFASAVGMKLNAAVLQVPGGKQYQDGDSCEGTSGHVYVKQFANVGDKTGVLYDGKKGDLAKYDADQVPLLNDELVTIAFVPANKATSIPAPPAYVGTNLESLEASSSTTTTPTTVATSSTTVVTVPATTAKSSSTTAKP